MANYVTKNDDLDLYSVCWRVLSMLLESNVKSLNISFSAEGKSPSLWETSNAATTGVSCGPSPTGLGFLRCFRISGR